MRATELSQRIDQALANEDVETLEALKGEFADDGEPFLPFEPALRLRDTAAGEEFEADVAIGLANGLSRALRKLRYRRKRRSGYAGPIIISEGDSWFQYPIVLDDVVDNLMERYAVLSLGAAGDTLSNMLATAEYREAIAEEGADVFLFSASGNDVLGGGSLADMLNEYRPGMEVGDIVRQDILTRTLEKIETGYTTVITEALGVNPRLAVLFHGYDKPVPRRDGRWLGKPMASRGIPTFLQGEVAGYLIDRLNERLAVLEARFPGSVSHVDCRGRVGGSVQSWYDELHPRNPGYERVAALFEAQIEELRRAVPRALVGVAPPAVVTRPFEATTTFDERLAAAEEEALIDGAALIPTEPGAPHLSPLDQKILADFLELEREQTDPDDPRRKRARRHMVPHNDEKAFERILGISNLFPINYLSRGAAKARAVAKIQLFFRGEIPAGSGSGFLVGPGLMLTNNHVIDTRDAANRAKATFDYQEDDAYQNLPTKTFQITDDVFFSSDRLALDFTFVSVAPVNALGEDLSTFGQFTLIEESGKAVKNEAVSIIQHPRGGLKSIALRDSKILGVKGDFIYYTTDTEPGSSGAPVLNDQWLPVALHHRSVPHPEKEGKWIANRGIRISQIFARLRAAAAENDTDAIKILKLLGAEAGERPVPVPVDGQLLRHRETDFMPSAPAIPRDTSLPTTEEADFPAARWDGIDGYDPNFLTKPIPLPLPAGNAGVNEVNGRPDLPYLHFSVVMHQKRKLPMVTACNVDGSRLQSLNRRGDWRFDPRMPRGEQVGNDAYRRNDYDRGHLIRRLAPMWGTREEARFAEADTFHYTVAAPQHARLNQKAWLELENYLLDWAHDNDARLSIFTGPVFRPDDPLYRGIVRVPADYWKVAVAESAGGFRSVGYLHTQKNLIPTVEEAFGDFKTHRVPVHVLAELSGLNLDALMPDDVAGGAFETTGAVHQVSGPEDIGF